MNIPTFEEIISLENLFSAWNKFLHGKKNKKDVQEFQLHVMDNIFSLYEDLKNKTYTHGPYHAFNINDPKPRSIHKATVRDRLLHHAVYRKLYPHFDNKFIHDSYSCRKWKGTHKAILRFEQFSRKVSKNYTKTLWVLKCDIRKFFASIDQEILLKILKYSNLDKDTIWLLEKIISSFYSTTKGRGLPLGNLTSQLLVNIYMDCFDQFVKHRLKSKYYIRYADDFIFMSLRKRELEDLLIQVEFFLEENLKLSLHPDKVFIKTLASGADFLGWIHFSYHRVLRTSTKRRMLKNLKQENKTSYLGMLKWGNTYKIKSAILTI